ncbi:hypothetical protein UFOVP160_16 [uncultured Caudovirales phage]|uniref:DNA transfer protein n=1 Tax=uncultured Caudovirales phage TaxID=2100421 RepID=A0A6J7WAT7_9CAUD|nr:hypothetical protein UFOVP160_16 [uncultured Caudovirales phage]
MTFWVAGAVIGSAVIGSSAANKASNTQAAAATQSADVSKQISDQQIALAREQYAANVGLQEPFRQAGIKGQNRLMDVLGLSGNTGAQGYGSAAKDFSMSDFTADPGYAFRLSEGQKAVERSAAARGGLLSGGTGKALQRFGQDLGSQEYTNAFNRYQTNRANLLQPLQSLAGQGQTTANTIGNYGQTMVGDVNSSLGNYGTNASNALVGGANARASGYVGGANALTSALGTGLNYYQNQSYINRMPTTATFPWNPAGMASS